MKVQLLFFTLLIVSLPSFAQEKYFHELKGMEDSTGTTHLFYRVFESYQSTCSFIDTPASPYTYIDNSIYHFDTKLHEEKKQFDAGRGTSIDCTPNAWDVENFLFPTSNPDSAIIIRSGGGGLSLYNYLEINNEAIINLGLGNPNGLFFDPIHKKLILNTPIYELVVKRKSWEEKLGKSFFYTLGDSLWDYDYFRDIPDSLFIDFTIFAVNPYFPNQYFGIKNNTIVLSDDFGITYDSIAVSPYSQDEIWKLGEYYFDSDSTSIYFSFAGYKETYLLNKTTDNWNLKPVTNSGLFDSFAISKNDSDSISFFYSKNDSLFYAKDFGSTLNFIMIFDFEISGLYKKPDSDILFVLTTNELYEVNTSTLDKVSLKKLPVSNEEHKEIPSSIILHQNYPNPFNPTTTISFELDKPANVTLTVIDALGRTVATLLQEQKSMGLHQVQFDASNLSSGIYFYRLKAGAFMEIKRLTIIK